VATATRITVTVTSDSDYQSVGPGISSRGLSRACAHLVRHER